MSMGRPITTMPVQIHMHICYAGNVVLSATSTLTSRTIWLHRLRRFPIVRWKVYPFCSPGYARTALQKTLLIVNWRKNPQQRKIPQPVACKISFRLGSFFDLQNNSPSRHSKQASGWGIIYYSVLVTQ